MGYDKATMGKQKPRTSVPGPGRVMQRTAPPTTPQTPAPTTPAAPTTWNGQGPMPTGSWTYAPTPQSGAGQSGGGVRYTQPAPQSTRVDPATGNTVPFTATGPGGVDMTGVVKGSPEYYDKANYGNVFDAAGGSPFMPQVTDAVRRSSETAANPTDFLGGYNSEVNRMMNGTPGATYTWEGRQITPEELASFGGENGAWFQDALKKGWFTQEAGTPAHDWQGGFGRANVALDQAGGMGGYNAGMGQLGKAGGTMDQAVLDALGLKNNAYDPNAVNAMMTNTGDVLGRLRGDYGQIQGTMQGIMGGSDALFNANRLMIQDDAQKAYRDQQNQLGGALADSGLAGSAFGLGAQQQASNDYQRSVNEALLAQLEADTQNRMQAGQISTDAMGAMGGMENTQAGRMLQSQIANQGAGLEAGMFNEEQRAEAAKQGIDRVNALINAGQGQTQVGLGMGTLQGGMNADRIAQAAGFVNAQDAMNQGAMDKAGVLKDQANLGMDQQRLWDAENTLAYQQASGQNVDPNTLYNGLMSQGQQPLMLMSALLQGGLPEGFFETPEGKQLMQTILAGTR